MNHSVFVFGCARSGTTAIANSLRKAGYAGVAGEGHLVSLIHSLRHTVRHYREAKQRASAQDVISAFAWDMLQATLDDHFRSFYSTLYGGACFVDKTPYNAMPYPIEDIRRIWPDARIIHCQRNGIDNVNSQLRKFLKQGFGFDRACINWADAAKAWDSVVESAKDITYSVEHQFLLREPQTCGHEMAAFLGLDADESQRLIDALTHDFPENTGASATTVEWTAEERRFFVEICGPWMQRLGYDLCGPFAASTASTAVVLSSPALLESASVNSKNPALFAVEKNQMTIHPPTPGKETKVVFPVVSARGCRKFIARVLVRNPLAEKVRFFVEFRPSHKPVDAIRHSIDVTPGETLPWVVPLPEACDTLEVMLSTTMAPGAASNLYAWATLELPRLV